MPGDWQDTEDFIAALVSNRHDRGEVTRYYHELSHHNNASQLKKANEELAKLKAEKEEKEEKQARQDFLAKVFSPTRSSTRINETGGQHDDCDEGVPRKRCSRCGDWKYPCGCGDGFRARRRQRESGGQSHCCAQVNVFCLSEDDSDSEYAMYYDWPPRDFYKRRWGGLLPDKKLPWIGEEFILDGDTVIRPRRSNRRRSYIDLRGIHFH